MPFLLIAAALLACALAALAVLIWLAVTAPVGFEDERGFHYGTKPTAPTPLSPVGRQPAGADILPGACGIEGRARHGLPLAFSRGHGVAANEGV